MLQQVTQNVWLRSLVKMATYHSGLPAQMTWPCVGRQCCPLLPWLARRSQCLSSKFQRTSRLLWCSWWMTKPSSPHLPFQKSCLILLMLHKWNSEVYVKAHLFPAWFAGCVKLAIKTCCNLTIPVVTPELWWRRAVMSALAHLHTWYPFPKQ